MLFERIYDDKWTPDKMPEIKKYINEYSDKIETLDIIKDKYELFLDDVNKILSRHNMSFLDINRASHPINVKFNKDREIR